MNKAFCMKHPTSFVGKDQWNNYYERCWNGKKMADNGIDEKCDIRVEEEPRVSER